jgi:hypothetical protein
VKGHQMKRVVIIVAVVAVLAAAAFGVTQLQNRVEVQTGERVVCSYGHVVSEDIQTLKVPASQAAQYSVTTTSVLCDRHAKLEALFSDAQEALEAGELAKAEAKLAEIVALDPTFPGAKKQLDEIAAGKKPQPVAGGDTGGNTGGNTGGDTGGGTTPPDDEYPGDGDLSGPIGALAKWIPDNITGFTAQPPTVDVLNLARNYRPDSGSDIFSLVIVAEQFRTPSDAVTALDRKIKSVYPNDATTLKINGRSVYFGTDGSRFAAAGLTDGAVLVAVEMSPKQGSSPAQVKSAMEAVLKQLP